MCNSNSLSGKTALITGGAKRIGKAICLALAGEGADVVVHYNRSGDEAASTVAEILRQGVKGWALQADLGDVKQSGELMDRAIEAAGKVDILINNASIYPADSILEATAESIEENIRVHCIGPLLAAQAFARQGISGHIVNFLDTRIVDYDKKHASYHLSKRMLFTLTRMLAVELAPEIAVNGICPGLIMAPEGMDESFLEKYAHTNPLQRHGGPGDIAEAVLFLVKSRFITGQVIYVDGGRHIRGNMYGV